MNPLFSTVSILNFDRNVICGAKKKAVEAYDINEPFADLIGAISDEDNGEFSDEDEVDEASDIEDEIEEGEEEETDQFLETETEIAEIRNVLEKAKAAAENWHVVQALSYKPDRSKSLKKAFKKDFPHIKFKSTQDIMNLASRSAMLEEWFAGFNMKFALEETVPLGFREVITDASEFRLAQSNISKHRAINVTENDAIRKVQEAAFKEIKDIKTNMNKKRKELEKNKILRVLVLKTTELPLTLTQAIDKYTPASADNSLEKKQYAQEILFNFKLELLRVLKNNPQVDIDKLIKKLAPK